MRKTVLTFTAPMILAAACAQGNGGPDEELTVRTDEAAHSGFDSPGLEPYAGDEDQGCLGEILTIHFTATTAKVTGIVSCIRGGKLKFKTCIHRRLIQSASARVWGLFRPAWKTAPALLGEIRGTEDCFELPEQTYDEPPHTSIVADVFCGRSGAKYSYTPSLQSVESFWPNVFLGDVWHMLAEGPSQIHTCGL